MTRFSTLRKFIASNESFSSKNTLREKCVKNNALENNLAPTQPFIFYKHRVWIQIKYALFESWLESCYRSVKCMCWEEEKCLFIHLSNITEHFDNLSLHNFYHKIYFQCCYSQFFRHDAFHYHGKSNYNALCIHQNPHVLYLR